MIEIKKQSSSFLEEICCKKELYEKVEPTLANWLYMNALCFNYLCWCMCVW